MSNETTISVRGWAGNEPVVYTNSDATHDERAKISTAVVNVGVTPRVFNKKTGQFEDGNTMWYSVRCYGALARHVSMCVHKGTPLLVRGRLVTRTYVDKENVSRTSHIIMADSVGIDLNNGIASYAKLSQSQLLPVPGEPNHWEVGCDSLLPGEEKESELDDENHVEENVDSLDPTGTLMGV